MREMHATHRWITIPVIGLCSVVAPSRLTAQLGHAKILTLDAAKAMANAAESRARENGWNVGIAIVDAAGDLILFRRLDGTQPASIAIAIAKARTAARFRRPTKALDDRIGAGRVSLLGIDDMLPLEGGVPVIVEQEVVGGIGVSGAASNQDAMVARAGASALRP